MIIKVRYRLLISLILILILISAFSYNHFLPFYQLEGKYVLINYEESPVWSFSPDTLLIGKGTFESGLIGKGTYSNQRTLEGYKIDFHGGENLSTHLRRYWFGKPMIVVFDDLKQGYIRID